MQSGRRRQKATQFFFGRAQKNTHTTTAAAAKGRRYNSEKINIVVGEGRHDNIMKKLSGSPPCSPSLSQRTLAGHCSGNKHTHSSVLWSSAAGQQLTQQAHPPGAQNKENDTQLLFLYLTYAQKAQRCVIIWC